MKVTPGVRGLALASAAAVVLAAGCGTVTPTQLIHSEASVTRPTAAAVGARPALTHGGRLLAEFEGLLRATYGHRLVCERDTPGPAIFLANGCSPLAKYSPYFYTFAHSSNAVLHLSHRQPRVFGNYPRAVLIGRETVRCNTGKHPAYLVTYADAVSFSLTCLHPQ